MTDDGSVAAAFAQIKAGGGLDVLVNNAGIGMLALNGPDALRVFDTNGVGIIRVIEAALPLLRRSENPVVVNISSALGPFWANHEPSRPASKVSAIVYGAAGDDTRAGATVHETSCDLASLADVRAAGATGTDLLTSEAMRPLRGLAANAGLSAAGTRRSDFTRHSSAAPVSAAAGQSSQL